MGRIQELVDLQQVATPPAADHSVSPMVFPNILPESKKHLKTSASFHVKKQEKTASFHVKKQEKQLVFM